MEKESKGKGGSESYGRGISESAYTLVYGKARARKGEVVHMATYGKGKSGGGCGCFSVTFSPSPSLSV
jgi:hypothetical protein